jgi:hypothetical protein
MHGTFHHTAPTGADDRENVMFALINELHPGQRVSYQGRTFSLLMIERGLAWLAGLTAPVPTGKLVQVG